MKLVLSFDIENKYDSSTDLITADSVEGKPGTRWIMDQLEARGLKGVFFVNIYEHQAYPSDYLPELLREIHVRGHEAALHMHHESFLKEKDSRDYTKLTYAQKSNLIQYGVNFFEEHLGQKPVSYRAGAWVIDDETFDILEEAGIQVDSSLCYGYNQAGDSWFSRKNLVSGYRHIQLPHKIRPGLWEVPVTTIGRVTEFRNFSFDHFHVESQISALSQMCAAGMSVAVMVAHSFSFLKFGDKKTDILGPDRELMASFEQLLDFTSSHPSIQTSTFSEMVKSDMSKRETKQSYVPQVEKRWIGRRIWDSITKDSPLLEDENLQPNKNKTVWLHIGTWKTGTTTIQKFLRKNTEWLEANNYLLPTDDLLLNSPNSPYLCNHRPVIGKDSEVLKTLKARILKSSQENIILTSENIVYADREAIQQLRVALAGCDIKVIVYLRRQDQYCQSLYGQHIRGGVKTSLDFEAHFKKHREKYNYEKILQNFSEIFGQENIIVRPYEKQQWYKQELIEDFCSNVNLPSIPTRLKASVTSTNFPFSLAALEYIRMTNNSNVTNRAKLISLLGQYSRDVEKLSVFHSHNWISGARQREILEEFKLGNEAIARTYMHREDGVLFHAPLPAIDSTGFDTTDNRSSMMDVASYLWEQMQPKD